MIDYKYKKKENKFTENGHTMFEEDVLQRLKRLAHLEEQIKQGQLLPIDSVSNSALINYIENDAEIAMPIDELMHEDGRQLTKKEYGKVLLKYLVKELREHYC